jgi:hypothetical protein
MKRHKSKKDIEEANGYRSVLTAFELTQTQLMSFPFTAEKVLLAEMALNC